MHTHNSGRFFLSPKSIILLQTFPQTSKRWQKQEAGKAACVCVVYVAEGNVHSCCMRRTMLNNLKGDIFFNVMANSQFVLCGACIVWTEKLGRVTTPRTPFRLYGPHETYKQKEGVNMRHYPIVLISMFIYLQKWPNNVCSLSQHNHIIYMVIYKYIYKLTMPYRRGTFNLIISTR